MKNKCISVIYIAQIIKGYFQIYNHTTPTVYFHSEWFCILESWATIFTPFPPFYISNLIQYIETH